MVKRHRGSGYRLDWRGDEVYKLVQDSSRKGIDVTLAHCVPAAKRNTPVVTGTAQGSIRQEPAKIERYRVYGLWGSFDVNYFIYLETGTGGRPGRNMLRGAADRFYPQLADNINNEFKKAA